MYFAENFNGRNIHGWNRYKTLECAEDLIIRGIIGDVIALSHSLVSHAIYVISLVSNRIHISNNSGKAGETCATTGNDANILVGVFTGLVLAVGLVVKVCNRLAKCY